MAEDRMLSSTEAIGLVARREIRERMRARSFVIGTGLLVAAIVAIGLIVRFAGDDGPSTTDVAVVSDPTGALEVAIEETAAAVDIEVAVTTFDDEAAAHDAVEDGEVDLAVDPGRRRVVFADEVDHDALALVQQAWAQVSVQHRLAEAGLDATEIAEVMTVPALEPTSLDGDDGLSGIAVLTGTIAAVLLFMSLQTFGTYVLTGVVEEKSSAVVEVLLARARADQLLAGKVIGIGVVALVQFVAAIAAALVSLALSDVDVPTEIWSSVPMMLVWFLGGFAMYATLFAVAGSLVSRQEDAQSAAAPITYALVGAYVLVFVVGYVPDSTPSIVLSLLPPTAPFMMPMRMAAGAASVVEVVVAVVGLVLATLLAWKLAGRIYEKVLLHRGSRVAWREALALGRGRSADGST